MPLFVVVFVLVSTAPNFNPDVQCVFVLVSVDDIVICPLPSVVTVVAPDPLIWYWFLSVSLSNSLIQGLDTFELLLFKLAAVLCAPIYNPVV